MSDRKKLLACALSLLGLSLLCCGAMLVTSIWTDAVNQREQMEGVAASEGIEGLDNGVSLDPEYNYVTDGLAVFDDRAVEIFSSDSQTLSECGSAAARLLNSVPSNVSKYLMLSPTRAQFESSMKDISQDEIAAIKTVYQSMPEDVTCIDSASYLAEHSSEYLYYRLDNDWTSLGAYWGSRALIDTCSVAGIDISEYNCDLRRQFHGQFNDYVQPGTPDDEAPVYTHKHLSNSAQVSIVKLDGEVTHLYDAPAIAASRGGNYAELGQRVAMAIIEGDGGNERNILIVGDSASKRLATWLIASFDKIVYIGLDWNELTPQDFQNLFIDEGITDFLISQSIAEYSIGNGNSSLLDLVEGE